MNFRANILKKSIIILILILVAGTAFGASGDTINIGGVVPLNLELTVATVTGVTDNLTLVGTTAIADLKIADITVETNNSAGWEFWIYSENVAVDNAGDSVMMNADDDEIVYTLTYTGAATTTASPNTVGIKFGEEAGMVGDIAALGINYQQTNSFPAGYYSDQLTLVLRAK